MAFDMGIAISGKVEQLFQTETGKKKIEKWIELLTGVNKRSVSFIAAKQMFNKRGTRAYATTGKIRNSKSVMPISVRYHGHEIGEIHVGIKGSRKFYLTKTETYCNTFEKWGIDQAGTRGKEWDSKEVKLFFKTLWAKVNELPKVVLEHEIETILIHDLLEDTLPKKIICQGIRPVTIGGLPFQMPIPFSPSDAEIRLSGEGNYGHIDVLARTQFKEGGGLSLSVLELKKPKGDAHIALFQAFIYACALRQMLISEHKNVFLKLFGISRDRPIPFRALAVIDERDIEKMKRSKLTEWVLNDPLCKNGQIVPGLLVYEYRTDKVIMKKLVRNIIV